MSRFALVAILCVARCIHVTIEQPRSSVMKYAKYFKHIEKNFVYMEFWIGRMSTSGALRYLLNVQLNTYQVL